MKSIKFVTSFITLLFTFSSLACEQSDSSLSTKAQAKAAAQTSVEAIIKGNESLTTLISCLRSPAPLVRDNYAYTAVSDYLRGESTDASKVIEAFSVLMDELDSNTQTRGFEPWARSFLILVLSEFARFDRISPIFTPEQRESIVELTSNSINQIDDYRGLTIRFGWIHKVAHHADLVLQLALNNAIEKEQLELLASTLWTQISPKSAHAYIHNESDRLARAFVYLMLRKELNDDFWLVHIQSLGEPLDSMESWGDAYNSLEGLAHMHNRRLFLARLSLWTDNKQNERLKAVNVLAIKTAKKIQ